MDCRNLLSSLLCPSIQTDNQDNASIALKAMFDLVKAFGKVTLDAQGMALFEHICAVGHMGRL